MNKEMIEKGLAGKRAQIERQVAKLPPEQSREEHRSVVMREVDLSRRKIADYQDKIEWHNKNIDRLLQTLTAPEDGVDRTKLRKLEADLAEMEELVEFMRKTEIKIENEVDSTAKAGLRSHMKDLEKRFRSAKGPKI